jgi:hypothetical protein
MKFIITENQKKNINNFFKTINEQVIKPNTKSDITKFQNWVINTKKDSTILGRYGADGDWGPKTQNAWDKYGNEYLKSFRSKDNTKPKQSNEFPYNILNTNPTSKVIANIIKQSYGGPLGNDKEAWAEAAFNKIGNKEKYNNVSKLLGQDVFKYISSFMDTNQVYHKGPSIQDRYRKIFKVVKGGKKPQTRDEILKFQNWVISTKGDKVILGKYGADGDWGPASERAWVKYGSSYSGGGNTDGGKKTGDTSWVNKTSKQVQNQIKYLQSTGFNQPFTLLDDINSKVYAVNSDYSLYNSYNVITGRDRGDQIKDVTFGDWYNDNFLKNTGNLISNIYNIGFNEALKKLDSEYFDTKLWAVRNTPAGVFRANTNVASAWLQDKILTYFAEKDYGKKFIGFQTLNGDSLAIGFHGTKNPERINIKQDDWTRKTKAKKGNISFGCINFKDSDIQNISNFITAGQYSFWLPDATNDIVKLDNSKIAFNYWAQLV